MGYASETSEPSRFVNFSRRSKVIDGFLGCFAYAINAALVPDTMLYGFVGNQIVGRVSVRHELNEFLLKFGELPPQLLTYTGRTIIGKLQVEVKWLKKIEAIGLNVNQKRELVDHCGSKQLKLP